MSFISIHSQDVSCTELMTYIEQNGTNAGSVNSLSLSSSSWLFSVEAYSIENTIAIVATIKGTNSLSTKPKYIFCGVPKGNWDSFYGTLIKNDYGDRFHKYIMDYKCNCE